MVTIVRVFMHEIFLQNFFKAFIALDPVTLIPIFASLSIKIDEKKILFLSFFLFLLTSILITFFAIFGNLFLDFMGVSIYSFQIAGGIFLFFIAFEMLFEKRNERKKKFVNDKLNNQFLHSYIIFPIAVPLVVGPSAITLAILVSEKFTFSIANFFNQILPLILVTLITSIFFLSSKLIAKKLGTSLILILQKIFGIILGALAVEFIINGFKLTL